jgi:hypothetical protein
MIATARRAGFTHESPHNESRQWYTPRWVFDALRLRFDLDAASPGAAVVPWIPADRHLTMAEDGLTAAWHGRVWLNPPYGADTPEWLARFVDHRGGGTMLTFARTDTAWFHDLAVRCDAMLLLRGRIQFLRPGEQAGCAAAGRAAAGSMLLARGQQCVQALARSGLGYFIDLRTTPKECRP